MTIKRTFSGKWDKKEDHPMKNFVYKGDPKGDEVKNMAKNHKGIFDDKTERKNLIDTLRAITNPKENSNEPRYRMFYLKIKDNTLEDIMVETYDSAQEATIHLMMNSNNKAEPRTTDTGTHVFEWQSESDPDLTYVSISYVMED